MNAPEQVNATQPSERLTIGSLETLKVLAEPLRVRILSTLADARERPITIKEVAARLDVRPTRLYYHFNLLEEHGLIRVGASRVVSGIIEKSYQLAAKSITVDPALLLAGPAGREATAVSIAAVLQATATEIAAALEAGAGTDPVSTKRQLHLNKTSARISPEKHAEFMDRLEQLVEEFESVYGEPGTATPNRALLVAYYPTEPLDSTEATDQ